MVKKVLLLLLLCVVLFVFEIRLAKVRLFFEAIIR